MGSKTIRIISNTPMSAKIISISLLKTSKEFLTGYQIIGAKNQSYKGPQPNLFLFKLRFHLISHALELAFKAFLCANGLTLRHLRSIGHNLNRCLEIAEQNGLNILNNDEKEIITRLNKYFCKKEFEYEQMNYKGLPLPEECEKIAKKLLTKIETVRKSRTILKKSTPMC